VRPTGERTLANPDLLKAALADIARANGMTEIARAAGLSRANLNKALSPDGNPKLATVVKSPAGAWISGGHCLAHDATAAHRVVAFHSRLHNTARPPPSLLIASD
jgi:hypothetical protein